MEIIRFAHPAGPPCGRSALASSLVPRRCAPRNDGLIRGSLDQLAQQPSPQSQSARIALVLHGPELKYFTIRNYAMHRELVDLTAKLDAFQVIEVKACNIMMRQLGLQEADMPAFIEIVPYGPNEIRRLVGTGYLKM